MLLTNATIMLETNVSFLMERSAGMSGWGFLVRGDSGRSHKMVYLEMGLFGLGQDG